MCAYAGKYIAEKGTSLSKHARTPLYKPNKPKSLTTERALTFEPLAISPAICKRIFTISKGFVKMTWEPPAYNSQ